MKSIQITLLFIACLFLLNPVVAQGPSEDGSRFGQIIEHLEEKLELSEEQVVALEAIAEDFEERAAALREQEFENPRARHAAMKELRMAFWAAVKEVLTEEQLAQLGERRGERDEHPCNPENFDLEGLRAALENYHNENIKPVMLELRAALDASISAEDQATIADLRIAFADFKTQIQALKEEGQQEGADRQAIHTRMKELKEGMRDAHKQLHTLVERYKENIKESFESIAEQRTNWETAKKAIRVEYLGEECANRHESGRRGHDRHGDGWHDRTRDDHRGRHGRHGHRAGDKQHHKAKKAAHFLLLDPSGGNLTEQEDETTAPSLSLSPNPIYSTTILTYQVLEDAHITILLQDNKGNVLRKLVDTPRTAGTYSVEVDLSPYRTGSYYFSLSDGMHLISKAAILARE